MGVEVLAGMSVRMSGCLLMKKKVLFLLATILGNIEER